MPTKVDLGGTSDHIAEALNGLLRPHKPPKSEESAAELNEHLVATAKRLLMTTIEYVTAESGKSDVLQKLKSKYIVLNDVPKYNGAGSSSLTPQNGTHPAVMPGLTDLHVDGGKPSSDTLPDEIGAPQAVLFPLEKVIVGWAKKYPVGAGFYNMGNTCYMNSSLQVMIHCPSFINWLMNPENHVAKCRAKMGDAGPFHCTICPMYETVRDSHANSGRATKPYSIVSNLRWISKTFNLGRQEDAHEFMRFFIQSMEKSYLLNAHATKLDGRSQETTPLNQIFGGYMRSQVMCLRCRKPSNTYDHFMDLLVGLSIQKYSSNLVDILEGHFRRERLEGDNAYKCANCKTKVSATKKLSIARPPNVLLIVLKRFSDTGFGKNCRVVQYPMTLDMGTFLSAPTFRTEAQYRLTGVVSHIGCSPRSGHYTAVARASNGQLYLFDDSSVRPVPPNTALSQEAYILMYEKVKLNPPVIHTNIPSPRPELKFQSSSSHTVTTASTNGHLGSPLLKPKPGIITGTTFKIQGPVVKRPLLGVVSNGNPKPPPSATSLAPLSTPPVSLANGTRIPDVKETSLVPYGDAEDSDEDHSPKSTPPRVPQPTSFPVVGVSPTVLNCDKKEAGLQMLPRNVQLKKLSTINNSVDKTAKSDSASVVATSCGLWTVTDTKDDKAKDNAVSEVKRFHNMRASFDRERKKQNYEWVEVTKDVKSQSQERTKEEKDVVKELLDVPPGGYGSSVLSWDGRPNKLDTALKQSQEDERRRHNSGDSWDKDLDKGKMKKSKYWDEERGERENRFQNLQNERNRSHSHDRHEWQDDSRRFHDNRRSHDHEPNTKIHESPHRTPRLVTNSFPPNDPRTENFLKFQELEKIPPRPSGKS
ncbi:unnamed protein product [Darwinula stevensoni]|uniref:Ubiquitin carboxyl-terminal hydrolase n=1 Tax=Darwinula stevensoni TaxID=69355 RepID=A0A7R8X8N4_9CRUS|nr:unnamed protein product [Darwinula stevensoni]CAG0890298.1 unnamed protein product [Darwinula stevensoni]